MWLPCAWLTPAGLEDASEASSQPSQSQSQADAGAGAGPSSMTNSGEAADCGRTPSTLSSMVCSSVAQRLAFSIQGKLQQQQYRSCAGPQPQPADQLAHCRATHTQHHILTSHHSTPS